EEITVPAGTFKTRHYREVLGPDSKMDFWVSADVFPTGLVKMDAAFNQSRPPSDVTGSWVLVARGNDAQPGNVRKARRYNEDRFLSETADAMVDDALDQLSR